MFDQCWPVAQKAHKCCECAHTIEVGEEYEKIAMLQENTWYHYKTCEPCANLRDSLGDTTCVYYEGLSEIYTDYLINAPGVVMYVPPGSHAARLVPGYFTEKEEDDA